LSGKIGISTRSDKADFAEEEDFAAKARFPMKKPPPTGPGSQEIPERRILGERGVSARVSAP
jgi:hypothetical protein